MNYHNKSFKKRILVTILFIHTGFLINGQNFTVKSPDGLINVEVMVDSLVCYELYYDGFQIIKPSPISLTLSSGLILGKNPALLSQQEDFVSETINKVVGNPKSLENNYNQLELKFKNNFSVVFRVYNEGMAYRFKTFFEDDIIVQSEKATFWFSGTPKVFFPEADPEMRSWERSYDIYESIYSIGKGKFSIVPTMFSYSEPHLSVAVSESDLLDYPGMYLESDGESCMQGKWAHYPKTVSDPDDPYAYHRVIERENFIAKTNGNRNFPWRVIIVADNDKELLVNELIYKLASPKVLEDVSWIKPGKSAWEWWHDAILETGNFPSGPGKLSYDLYKYYVDFAADYGLEYITMDAGWNISYAEDICQYARNKGVKVFLWDFVNLPLLNPYRLTQFKNLGAAGVKIDLIERDDQVAINWLEKLAEECAKRELMLIFHGNPKPTGLERKYPNILNYEAVRGAECAKWDDTPNVNYHLQIPFIRMLAGPFDYTPGSMRNVHWEKFTPTPNGIPMTIGTRSHELAMYVVFDQPLAFLCDSPDEYRKYPEIMSFLSDVPTEWDETIPLQAKIGEYIVMARRNGEKWYIAAMTNEKSREISIDFSFLSDGSVYQAQIIRDNKNTFDDAKAYTYELKFINNGLVLNYELANGGGLVMVLSTLGTFIDNNYNNNKEKNVEYWVSDLNRELNIKTPEPIRIITITDISGINLVRKDFNQSNLFFLNFDISFLPQGLYFVSVEMDSGQSSYKFIKK